MHNINLFPVKGPPWKIHQAVFVVIEDDVDAIVKLWPEEWRGPLAEPLLEEQNVEEPPIHQVHGEEQECDYNQGDPSQENLEDDDDMEYLGQLPSVKPHAEEKMQTCVQPEEAQSSRKKKNANRKVNTVVLTEDELQVLSNAIKEVAQDNLSNLRAQQVSIANQV